MAISVIGLDFRGAPLNLREQVAMDRAQTLRLLQTIAAEGIFPEALVLSTCNRTEVYFTAGRQGGEDLPHLLGHIAELKGLPPVSDLSCFYHYRDLEAVRHLFRVAAALESQIVGEHEIMGQVKEAYRLASEARTAKFLFHKLMHWTIRTGKRVRAETRLGEGTASVSQAAVDLARQVFTSLGGRTVMLVGAGETGELAAQALVRAGAGKLIVANRTLATASQLAERFAQQCSGGRPEDFTCPALAKILAACSLDPPPAQSATPLRAEAISLDDVPSRIGEADLVISATASAVPVLTAAKLAEPLQRMKHALVMIDIAMPRDIEPALGELPDVFLYNMDSLESLVQRNVRQRELEIPRAEAIVADEVEGFSRWLSSLDVVPTIKLLEERLRQIGQDQVRRCKGQFSREDREMLDEFVRVLCSRILHQPIAFLHQLGDDGEESSLAAVSTLRKIFELDGPDPRK